MINNQHKYILVNKDYLLAKVCSSTDLNLVCNEYLSMVNDKLEFLVKLNVQSNEVKFNNLVIVETLKNKNRIHTIINKIYFDIITFKFLYEDNTHVPLIYTNYINALVNVIRKNFNLILNESKKEMIKPTIPRVQTMTRKEVDDKESLEKLIGELEHIKNVELDKLKINENLHKDIVTEYSQLANDLGDDKRELRKLKEREEELLNIFESDKGIYMKMKQQIENNTLSEDEIPELFSKKFPILKFLDEEHLLDTEDDYFVYSEMYNDVYKQDDKKNAKEKYIPHNAHYKKKRYESLDKLLGDTYSDDNEDEDEDDLKVDVENKSECASLVDHPIFN